MCIIRHDIIVILIFVQHPLQIDGPKHASSTTMGCTNSSTEIVDLLMLLSDSVVMINDGDGGSGVPFILVHG